MHSSYVCPLCAQTALQDQGAVIGYELHKVRPTHKQRAGLQSLSSAQAKFAAPNSTEIRCASLVPAQQQPTAPTVSAAELDGPHVSAHVVAVGSRDRNREP